MRILGTILMLVGVFVLIAAALSVFGMNLRANGMDVIGNVTSAPGAVITGVILMIGGAWLRRRAAVRSQSRAAV